jgi:Uma2 family endonuclease
LSLGEKFRSLNQGYLQASMSEILRKYFNKMGGPGVPGGWWIFAEAAVRYADRSLFAHDLAGWKRSFFPERPKQKTMSVRPDWVCEILSSNRDNDLVKKRIVLHEHRVPYYWIVDSEKNHISVLEWSEKGYVIVLDVVVGFEGEIPPFTGISLKANSLFGEEED